MDDEAVIGGVAALDQRRRHDDGEKAGLTQQRARTSGPGRGSLCRVLWPKSEAGDGAEPGHACNHPDQVPRRDNIHQQPASQCSHDEGGRAPQPQRPVIEAVPRHAAQRIGIRQRHHRRPHAGGGGEGEEYRQRLMLDSYNRKSKRGHNSRDDYHAA
jgi:hypothetical protein